MKKTLVKVMCFVFACTLMVACFAGCAGNKDENAKWVLGATGPLTGGAASYGISVKNGAQLAVEEINAKGGLNGYNFEFIMKDDSAEAAKVQAGYDALYEAGMVASLGSVTSGACVAFAENAKRDNVFFMTPSASQQSIIETGANAFRVCFGDPDQGTLGAQEIKKVGYSKVGCIYDSSDSYSSGIYDAFAAEMTKQGLAFSAQSFDAENKTDFSSQVEALKDCDVIFMPIYYSEAYLIAKACQAKGCSAVLFGCDGFDGVKALFDEGGYVSNKVLYITPFDVNSNSAVTAAFVTSYEAKYGEKPDQFAADGYDAVYAIYNAMKVADLKDPKASASTVCEAIKSAITAASFKYDGATGIMTWDSTGACNKVPVIVELAGSK